MERSSTINTVHTWGTALLFVFVFVNEQLWLARNQAPVPKFAANLQPEKYAHTSFGSHKCMFRLLDLNTWSARGIHSTIVMDTNEI